MVRKTITLPESTVTYVLEASHEGESFSAAVARLLAERARSDGSRMPSYVGSGEGPPDLSIRAEEDLRDILEAR